MRAIVHSTADIDNLLRRGLTPIADNRTALVELGFERAYPQTKHRYESTIWTQYGVGSRLGIDIPGEHPRNWPTKEWTLKTFRPGYHLEPSAVCQLEIGQGAMQATPLQPTSPRPR